MINALKFLKNYSLDHVFSLRALFKKNNNNNREGGIPQVVENTSSIMHKLCIVMCSLRNYP